MAENCSELYPWMYRSHAFFSEAAFARENDALTKALQISLLSGSSAAASHSPGPLSPATSSLVTPPAGDPSRRWAPPAGRIGKKRKSRASNRSPTTYITADPANFRALVQQVTGIRSADDDAAGLQVAAQPPAADLQGSCFLPTLDTSAFLLDEADLGGPGDGGAVDDLFLAEFDPFVLVPSSTTPDLWDVI